MVIGITFTIVAYLWCNKFFAKQALCFAMLITACYG